MRLPLLVLASAPLLLTGCGDHSMPTSDAMIPPSPAAATGPQPGVFLPYQSGNDAITYNTTVVPPGATAKVFTTQTTTGVTVRLAVTGMIPRRAYGAHLHTMPCNAVPDAAGPHYQHTADPTKPSVDPAFANPGNEVWLDFTADAQGAASATSVQPWSFGATDRPRSLILHEQVTRTGKGVAGTAGQRVACLTLPPT